MSLLTFHLTLVEDNIIIDDSCYQTVNIQTNKDVSFDDADKYCREELNGVLAEFNTEDEKQRV